MKNIKKTNITNLEIIKTQELWAQNIIEIGNLFLNKKNYATKAHNFVKHFYAFNISDVLFKPTLASERQFRYTFEDTLSYFIGGSIKEDKGFALKPWGAIRFGERKIVILEKIAIAMGNYFFQGADNKNEIKAEYTFGFIKDDSQKILINLHHSSIPFENK